ncbi:hypothetical protein LSTR_LSTR014093 [Laodelphax striatellus]|uniref:Uncharacterized protein n=1 Tax=Laodelphax striatellus TaxID=195883 RepID=A0A482WLU5_LAOST|nr:hypothetical protein LSTR_LSTR014093 [Laodelphax striatellus]
MSIANCAIKTIQITQRNAPNILNKCGLNEIGALKNFSTTTSTSSKSNSDLIQCPVVEEKVEVCTIDLTIPEPGYYDLGYCKPPCEDIPLRCPPKGQPRRKVMCCHIQKPKSWRNPCIILDPCEEQKKLEEEP